MEISGGVTEKVTEKMKDQQRSVSYVARAAGVSRSTMARRLDGKAPLTMTNLFGLTAALGVGLADLLPADVERVAEDDEGGLQ
jgi:transcriptional regulator with XRE-family HTH domain